MKAAARLIAIPSVAVCLVALDATVAFAQPDVPPPPTAGPALTAPGPEPSTRGDQERVDQEGMETLTRGPIHEAFANPAEQDPKPSPIVPEKPPADVPEQPPAYQPEGDFIWIPGYFEWEENDEGKRFIWVTGVWRQPPPGKRWMPGYWHEVDGGWQRVRGFWVDDAVEQVSYQTTPPPNSLEVGPSSPQPADNYFWIPGNWNYVNSNYAWQAGYWAPYQPNWVWVSARWLWTPAGYVFAPGYWDYRLANRGQIFAPVYFTGAIYTRPGWFYRPTVVIPTGNLFINLWLRPGFGSYYFGNYYGPQYVGLGFVPWANLAVYHRQRYFYDPFYSYAAVHYRRQGIDYLGRVQGWHQYYAEHPGDRPPPTWRQQQQWLATHRDSAPAVTTQLTAHHIAEVAQNTDSPLKLKKIDERTLQTQADHARQLREVDTARRDLEREHAHPAARLPNADNTVKLSLPKTRSPLTAAANTGVAAGNTPGNTTTAVPRNLAPPLPPATSANNAAKGKTLTPRANELPTTINPGAINPGTVNSGAVNSGKAGAVNAGKTGAGNVGANAGNIGASNAANIGAGASGQGGAAGPGGVSGQGGVSAQGNVRTGKTSGNFDAVPRGGNLPPANNQPPGNTNRGGQSNVRNFSAPPGDNKGGGSRGENLRGAGNPGGQNNAGAGNTSNNNSPRGDKGKKGDNK